MRNDTGLDAHSPRAGRSSNLFPTSLRAISSYLYNVSANAGSIASTVRSAGASVASRISLSEVERQREQVQWAGFDRLELCQTESRRVLLLTYSNGFQVLDVEEADEVQELVSKRDGPVGFLRVQPHPCNLEPSDGGSKAYQPRLLVVTEDTTDSGSGVPDSCTSGDDGVAGSIFTVDGSQFVPTAVRFYSLGTHSYVYKWRFRTAICAVRCSPRIVAVALAAQIYCFNAATLQSTFSVLTYPSPQVGLSGSNIGYGAMAVGPRWLAYAPNQPLVSNTGRVSPQHLSSSPCFSPSTSPANGSLVAHYAKESTKHIAVGIATLGDRGYKTLSRYCSELLPDGSGSPGSGIPSWKSSSDGLGTGSHDSEHAGTVILRDFVSKTVISQFRAHTSPLSALCFDPSGTLLVTASIHGHNLNVFRLTPPANGVGINSTSFDPSTSHVHLYKLCRGITNAVIQDISFSSDSHWIAVSSSRGTSHLFPILPFGGTVGPHTHGTVPADGVPESVGPVPGLPWWSNSGLVKSSQQAVVPPPPAITLSVAGRIKNGNGGWCGTVSGAAAAATGRMNCSSGAVAVVFHNAVGRSFESELGNDILKDQVWVVSPPGHLVRYAIRQSAGTAGLCNNNGPAGGVGQCSPSQTQEFRVVAEPLQKWDVSRKPNWVEREEKLDALIGQGTVFEANTAGVSCCKKGTSVAGTSESGRLGKEGVAAEDINCVFLSNAEVQMHQARSPIWSKSEISFHVFTGAINNGEFDGYSEIEKLSTRVVEVRRKDLVPVFEGLRNIKGVQGVRDLIKEISPNEPGFHMPLLKSDCLQDGLIDTNVISVQTQGPSSGSSYGSETSSFSSPKAELNGRHNPYKDLQDIHMPEVPCYFEETASFLHQKELSPTVSEKIVLQFGMSNSEFSTPGLSTQTPAHVIIDSSRMDYPQQHQWDVYDIVHGYMNGVTEGGPTGLGCLHHSVALPLNTPSKVFSMQAEKSVGIPLAHGWLEGAEKSVGIPLAHGWLEGGSTLHHSLVKDRVLHREVLTNVPPQDQWEESMVEGKVFPALPLQCPDNLNREYQGESIAIYNRKESHQQECDAAVEDVESISANNRTEAFEGGGKGEDVWEGAIFPFIEES